MKIQTQIFTILILNYNNERVFVIYSDYVIEVSSDKPLESIGKIPNNVSFEAIKSDKMYVRVDDDTIKQITLDLKDIEYDSQDIVDGQEKTTNNTTKNTTNNTKKTEQPKEEKKVETNTKTEDTNKSTLQPNTEKPSTGGDS